MAGLYSLALPGTCRAEMLADGTISERVLTADDLKRSPQLWLINSVHGMREAELTPRS